MPRPTIEELREKKSALHLQLHRVVYQFRVVVLAVGEEAALAAAHAAEVDDPDWDIYVDGALTPGRFLDDDQYRLSLTLVDPAVVREFPEYADLSFEDIVHTMIARTPERCLYTLDLFEQD